MTEAVSGLEALSLSPASAQQPRWQTPSSRRGRSAGCRGCQWPGLATSAELEPPQACPDWTRGYSGPWLPAPQAVGAEAHSPGNTETKHT